MKLVDMPKKHRENFMSLGDWQVFHDYEAGKINSENFCRELTNKLELTVSPAEFNHIWCACFDGEIEGVSELLAQVSQKVPLYTLSNTNEAHYDFFKDMPVFKDFKELLTSHKFKCRKPEALIYEKAIQHLGLKPEEILFVDDLEENIAAARAQGLHAELCFQSASRLGDIFRSCNLL